MANIVTPAIRKIYKDLIRQVVNDLNKPIRAYLPPEKEDCPNCVWDSINQCSSGKFDSSFIAPTTILGNDVSPIPFTRGRCPVCFGVGYLERSIARNIKALVKWNPSTADSFEISPVGREGAPYVRIKVLRSSFDDIVTAEYFEVDGVRCVLDQPPTIRGLGTQEELVVAYLLATEVGSDVKK